MNLFFEASFLSTKLRVLAGTLALLLVMLPGWVQAEDKTEAAAEAQSLTNNSKVQFYKPCPANTRLGYVTATLEKEKLAINARCVGEQVTASVYLNVPNTLLKTEKPLVLENSSARLNITHFKSRGEKHIEFAFLGDAEQSCSDIQETALQARPYPRQFYLGSKEWEHQIEHLVDAECKVIAVHLGNWLAVLPANYADTFQLYDVQFDMKPGEYSLDQRLLKKTVSMPAPIRQPESASMLNKNGKAQFFQPCPSRAIMRADTIALDSESLIFHVTCHKGNWSESKIVKYPNTLLDTDRRVIMDSPYTFRGTDRAALVEETGTDGFFGERNTARREDETLCSQVEVKVRKIKGYPEYLMFSRRDPRESLGYSIDSECRLWAVEAGNLIAVFPTNTEENFSLHGIEYSSKPLWSEIDPTLQEKFANQAAWVDESIPQPIPEPVVLTENSDVQFYQPCPNETRLGHVELSVEPDKLMMNARCIGEDGISSKTLVVPNTLLHTEQGFVLERQFGYGPFYGAYNSKDPSQYQVSLLNGVDKPCSEFLAKAIQTLALPKRFFVSRTNEDWRQGISAYMDVECKVIGLQVGNWLAVLPANYTHEFNLYDVNLSIKPVDPTPDSAELAKIVQMPSPSATPKHAHILNKEGKVQFFQPCPDQVRMRINDVAIDQKHLIIDTSCGERPQYEKRFVLFPNNFLDTDRRITVNPLHFFHDTDRENLIGKKHMGDDKKAGFIIKRDDRSPCTQIEVEVKKSGKYPEYLGFQANDRLNEVGILIDGECRSSLFITGNLIAVIPTDVHEDFVMFGIRVRSIPVGTTDSEK